MSSHGSSARIRKENHQVLAQAEFVPFAPAPCVCCSGCHSDEARARTYAHVYENRIERNYPAAPFACCTSEVCIVDRVWVTYFDRPPMRAGMCCFCIPATCCGPPVIYSKTPKCCCIDMTSCFGQQILTSPCNCLGLNQYLVCGAPCYECCGAPTITGIKNSAEFQAAWKAAVEAYKEKNPDLPAYQMALFVVDGKAVVAPAPEPAPQPGPPAGTPMQVQMVQQVPMQQVPMQQVPMQQVQQVPIQQVQMVPVQQVQMVQQVPVGEQMQRF